MTFDLVRTRLISAFLLLGLIPLAASGEQSDIETPNEILIVALGGYNSCKSSSLTSEETPYGMDMYTKANTMVQKLGRQVGPRNVRTLYGCLFSSPPPNGEGSYITSDAPGKVFYGNGYDILKTIQSMVKSTDTPIFLMGHSYGAWLSMFLDLELGNTYNVPGIFTIDPISPKTCGPMEVVFGASGCHEAPTDLDTVAIKDLSPLFLNFYQTQDSWLTSSSIPDADNFRMTYRRSHTKIDGDDRVWDKITQAISKIL